MQRTITTREMIANRKIDEEAEKVFKLFLEFLRNFDVESENLENKEGDAPMKEKAKYYAKQVEGMKNSEKLTLYIDFAHITKFDPKFALQEAILHEYYRYKCNVIPFRFEPYLRKAIYYFILEIEPRFAQDNKEFYIAFYHLPNVDKYFYHFKLNV